MLLGALSQHVVYLHDGEVEPIRILPAPLTVLPDQLAYVHRVTLAVQQTLHPPAEINPSADIETLKDRLNTLAEGGLY